MSHTVTCRVKTNYCCVVCVHVCILLTQAFLIKSCSKTSITTKKTLSTLHLRLSTTISRTPKSHKFYCWAFLRNHVWFCAPVLKNSYYYYYY